MQINKLLIVPAGVLLFTGFVCAYAWSDEMEEILEKAPETSCGNCRSFPKSEEELRKILSPAQYDIVRRNGTERPFLNEYWDNKQQGIYVDIVSGEPLFSSAHKFDSGTGWPSFTQPLVRKNIVERRDKSFGMIRVEVRSRFADSHLGHLFEDGPAPTGQRYCINSGALKFIPVEKLEEEGYGEFLPSFK